MIWLELSTQTEWWQHSHSSSASCLILIVCYLVTTLRQLTSFLVQWPVWWVHSRWPKCKRCLSTSWLWLHPQQYHQQVHSLWIFHNFGPMTWSSRVLVKCWIPMSTVLTTPTLLAHCHVQYHQERQLSSIYLHQTPLANSSSEYNP